MQQPSPNGHPESGRAILLRAAADLPAPFTFGQLTVAAWKLSPSVFGLEGFDLPDSRKVAVIVHGSRGVVAAGLLMKVGETHFKVARPRAKEKPQFVSVLDQALERAEKRRDEQAASLRNAKAERRAARMVDAFSKAEARRLELEEEARRREVIEQQLPAKAREWRQEQCRHGLRPGECAECGQSPSTH